jgi:DNA-directed RNA polymerase subunit M/transcription elongation factor TFIIS
MMFLKACPRCRGDLYINRDIYGTYLECVQCGYIRDLAEETASRLKATADSLEAERKAA